ncbi:lipopolysaccharide-induced tumor necrosis factor-alpha factor homolog [Paramacrobiotus metropolitanus]|uniref:lipopolysaccharide-induced tumor necrosis factor-alpha factor homolog n=1 Tax=Paramacrobiotus metropolitanus TaxID=2943436 RepID=UPI002445D576|nr:lipopolysaccharide-induced tumor necrosis factor-alpha factor homolog [Paramacrobiotus metropolitanus]XP_055336465.1 lipopolysaccharide-induced tumor necrosis factor-alpha factor homolog [Paramacrobiotus metropolitanus]
MEHTEKTEVRSFTTSGPPPYPMPEPNATYATGPALAPQTVYVQAPAPGTMLSAEPVMMTCPHCSQQIQTRVVYESGALTWLLVGGSLLIGCWLGCCLIPTCIDACKDAVHTCPNCKNFIGKYKRL